MSQTPGNRPTDIEMGINNNTDQRSIVPNSRTGTTDTFDTALSSLQTTSSAGPDSTGDGTSNLKQPAGTAGRRSNVYQKTPAFDPSSPGDWVVDNHRLNLITEIDPSPEGKPLFRVNFAELQRMRLRKIQVKLIKHSVDMRITNREMSPDWEKDIAEYIQAMKDYDYIAERGYNPNSAFVATGNRVIDRWVMGKIIGQDVDKLGDLAKIRSPEPYEERPRAIVESVTVHDLRKRQKACLSRMKMAFCGSLLLLGPMWLMVLHKSVYTGLITTTVCVVFTGALCTVILDKPMDVLSATSAYAAVLVVFVGLTS